MKRVDEVDRELKTMLRSIASRTDCPPEDQWIDLLRGELDEAVSEKLREHLEACPECAATARDARGFLLALNGNVALPRRSARVRSAAWLAAASVILAAGALFWLGRDERPGESAVARWAAALDVPAPDEAEGSSVDSELVYRSGAASQHERGHTVTLAPYRAGRWLEACEALAAHGKDFPQERESRFLAAIACLKAGELARAEALLASLAAVEGERREAARELLERLRELQSRDHL